MLHRDDQLWNEGVKRVQADCCQIGFQRCGASLKCILGESKHTPAAKSDATQCDGYEQDVRIIFLLIRLLLQCAPKALPHCTNWIQQCSATSIIPDMDAKTSLWLLSCHILVCHAVPALQLSINFKHV